MTADKIPIFYDTIDRHALVVRRKKPFADWLNSISEENGAIMDSDILENNVYLVRERDSNEEVRNWLKRNFDKIFINELNDWYTNEEIWPQKRTYKLFKEWFDVEICSMILDLEDFPVTKDEF